MEPRQLIAYLILALMAAGLFAVYWFLSRERRAHHRAHRTAQRRSRERIEEAADRP
jgi:Flp pilus assembly protein TadB